MSDLRIALRKLITDWNERWHGGTKRLATQIKDQTGQDVYKRLLRELEGRPSWQVVEWVVEYCTPIDAAPGWRTGELERFAGLWHEEQRTIPPGYSGRVVNGDRVIREALTSWAEADDPLARLRLLELERQGAEDRIHEYERQVTGLNEQLRQFRSDLDALQANSTRRTAKLELEIETVTRHLHDIQQQLATSLEANTQLVIANDELQQRERRIRSERDEARDLADKRYQQIEIMRSGADRAQERLRTQISDLEREMVDLRRRMREIRADDAPGLSVTADPQMTALLDEVSNLRAAVQATLRTIANRPDGTRPVAGPAERHRREDGPGYEWMRDDAWLGTEEAKYRPPPEGLS